MSSMAHVLGRTKAPCSCALRCHELKEDTMATNKTREITVAELYANLQPIEVVAVRTSLGHSSVYRRMKEGTFPKSHKIGDHTFAERGSNHGTRGLETKKAPRNRGLVRNLAE